MKERIYDWVGGLGIICSVLIAIGIAVMTILHPVPGFPTSPYDKRWAVVYAGMFLLVLLLFRHKSGSTLITLIAAVSATFLLIPLFSSDTRWAVLTWLILVYLFASLGAQALRWFFPTLRLPLLERWLISIAVGMGILALMMVGLGVAGLYYRPVAWGIMLVLGVLTWKVWWGSLGAPTLQWLRMLAPTFRSRDRTWAALGLGFLFICLWGTYIWALAPAIRYDALSYHLAAPAIYIRSHGIVEIPESFNTYWAHYADMLFTLAMLLVGQPLTGLLHFSAGLLSAGFVYALTRRISSVKSAWIASVVFCSIPIISVQAGTAYIDLFTTLFVVGAVYAGVGWYQNAINYNRESISWLALCGGFSGLAIGTKLAALPILIPFGVLLGIGILRRYNWKLTIQSLFWWGLPAVILVIPWLLRDWSWTGNPIFPMMDSLFRRAKPPAQADIFAIAPLKRSSILDYLLLPWILTTNAARYYLETPGGVLAGVPLLALPWSYWRFGGVKQAGPSTSHMQGSFNVRWLAVSLWLACLVGSILTFFSAPNIRYLIPLLTLLSSLVALNIEPFLPKIKTWSKLPVILILGLAVVYLYSTRLITLVHIPQYLPRYPVVVGLGFADRQKFLSEQIMAYDALQFLSNRDPVPKVLSLGNEFRLYTTARIFGIIFSDEARQVLVGNPDPQIMAARLAAAGYDYILINEPEMATSPLYAQGFAVTHEFLQRYARLEFTYNQVDVYKFFPKGVEMSALPANLLLNPGFESSTDQATPQYWDITGQPIYDQTGTESRSGQAAVRVHGPESGDPFDPTQQYSFLSQEVSVEPNQIYTTAYWVKPDVEAGEYLALQVNWLDTQRQVVGSAGIWKGLKSGWERYQMHIQAPAGANYARFLLLVSGNQAAWFDDVCFAQGDGCP